ncbi:2'-5' RNA ligase family protein [Ekhidna sp.]|uniref:2'-5' RNA ligase family protein n=1 Tax=Ekhidna sp. TaxID=2608089 RepID=UPI003297E22D
MSESLFFIALVPPSPFKEEITRLKMEMAEKYSSKHALKSPPHITLHMPFKWKEKKMDHLKRTMATMNEQMEPFAIKLKNFDFFEPRVVFVDVIKNEKLESLQKMVVDTCRKELKLDNANYKNRPFHPHVTIGFRDLKKPQFYEAKKVFENREVGFEFEVHHLSLLTHDGKQWNTVNF